MLVTTLLGRVGHRIDVVANGLEAVRAVPAAPYDLGLMEVQMPEVDGSSATKEIRQLSNDVRDIPIIALTANAMAGSYVLTQAGEEILNSATKIQDEFNAIEFELTGKDSKLEGDICITIPNGFATHLLMPDIAEFSDLYPGVNLEINMTYDFRNLASREAGVAIRHADNPPESLVGKQIGRVYFSAYASESYLETHDPIGAPQSCHWMGWGAAKNHLKWAEKKIPKRTRKRQYLFGCPAIGSH
jgi:CheY-like chemotaxis protein